MSEFGVYVHVPFCAARCDYCSFATWTDRHHLIGAYLGAMAADADRLVAEGMPAATSVFVGRPLFHALAAGGEEGVVRALRELEEELLEALRLSGSARLADTPGLIAEPPPHLRA